MLKIRSMKNKKNQAAALNGAKTREEIAWGYAISARTLKRRLKKLGIALPAGAVLPQDQKRIYEVLGPPIVQIDYPPPAGRRERKVEP